MTCERRCWTELIGLKSCSENDHEEEKSQGLGEETRSFARQRAIEVLKQQHDQVRCLLRLSLSGGVLEGYKLRGR